MSHTEPRALLLSCFAGPTPLYIVTMTSGCRNVVAYVGSSTNSIYMQDFGVTSRPLSKVAFGLLSTRQRLEVLLAIAQALTDLHHRGIVHADLKPSNVRSLLSHSCLCVVCRDEDTSTPLFCPRALVCRSRVLCADPQTRCDPTILHKQKFSTSRVLCHLLL